MCLASLYQSPDSDQPVLTEIAQIRIEPEAVELETLFGEKKTVHGKIAHIDFVRSRVVLAAPAG